MKVCMVVTLLFIFGCSRDSGNRNSPSAKPYEFSDSLRSVLENATELQSKATDLVALISERCWKISMPHDVQECSQIYVAHKTMVTKAVYYEIVRFEDAGAMSSFMTKALQENCIDDASLQISYVRRIDETHALVCCLSNVPSTTIDEAFIKVWR